MLSRLRARSQPLARRLARPLKGLGVTADALTASGLALGLGCGVAVGLGWHRSSLALGLAAAAADWLDGPLARERGEETPFGSLTDALADRLVEGAILTGLATLSPRLACACLLLSLLSSYIKARTGLVIPCDNRDWPGWGDRADRMVLLMASLWALPSSPVLSRAFLYALLAIATVGCCQRLAHARRLIPPPA